MTYHSDCRSATEAGAHDPHCSLLNRNVTVDGHRTSVRLEPAMWAALHEVCRREHASLRQIVTHIARMRTESTLTSAIRVYLLCYFQSAATETGHVGAGHGAALQHLRA
ncbi:MAG TPA: ribbon-helix-helix domain-containing protein [Stellaceae bacterium]|nr:ribbon-helix-helix domain-containing protein [Stellaceae bacterium]